MDEGKRDITFVGGYAGSGTRLIQEIMDFCGVWIGPQGEAKMNEALDLKHLIPPVDKLARNEEVEANKELLKQRVKDMERGHKKWSFKLGETMMCIDHIRDVYPDMRYILMVRHGVDQILNDHLQAELYAERFLTPNQIKDWGEFRKRAEYWSRVNDKAYRDGKTLGDRFLLVRLEDLCQNTEKEIARIMDFAELEGDIQELKKIINPERAGIGRRFSLEKVANGKDWNPKWVEEFEDYMQGTLKLFGYL